MKVETCSVCNGTGLVPMGFYDPPFYGNTYTGQETCRSCAGTGYVYVPEEEEWQSFGMTSISGGNWVTGKKT